MSKQLVATGKNGVIMTTCSKCEKPVVLTVQASIVVRNHGIRPMCKACRDNVPAARPAASVAMGL
ncbi:MAG: hypothetical protein KDK05_14205 [Candidatus Competibacteraceae bacterium]|nr:hypothetical protein [Candidatus Competibacteraceae bacterium]